MAVDPSNSESIMLFAYAFKGQADSVEKFVKRFQADSAAAFKSKADAATKKSIKDSIAVYRAQMRPLVDSVTAYQKLADEMPQKLMYTQIDRGKEKTTVRGQIENHGKVARTFALELEFVGKGGEVIGTQSVSVGPIAVNATGDFKTEFPKGGVWGVRYAKLPDK